MTHLGFLADGPERHDRACEQRVAELQVCKPEEREAIELAIESVEEERRESDDDRILW
jgi:hypothetical protein